MNYLLNVHKLFIFIINALVPALIGFIFAALSKFISRFFKLSREIETRLLIGFVAFGLIIGLFGTSNISIQFNQGGVKKIFILNKNNTQQLAVWFTRAYSRWRVPAYDQRLRCYELNTGKALDYIEMVKRKRSGEYSIYWLSGNYAWGHHISAGIQLLDMVKPEIIAEEKEILKRNPVLGNCIRLLTDGRQFDPITHGLHVETKDKKTYRIDLNLKATRIDRDLLEDNVSDCQRKPSVQKSCNINPDVYQKDWIFKNVKGTLGVNINKKGIKLSKDCVYLLEPEFIKELNFDPPVKNKIWVTHKSAILKEYDPLISFIDDNGVEINRINLYEVFKNRNIRVLNTYTLGRVALLFVCIGYTPFVDTYGFTLTALRTDSETGKIIDRIEYF